MKIITRIIGFLTKDLDKGGGLERGFMWTGFSSGVFLRRIFWVCIGVAVLTTILWVLPV